MTATPVLFRAALESLYTQEGLPPFLEMAAECLEAVFEDEQPSTLTPEQKKNRVAQRAKAVSVLKGKYPNIDFNKEDTDRILGMYANYIRFGTIYPNSPNNPKPIPQTTPQVASQPQPKPQQQQPKAAQPAQNTQNSIATVANRQNTSTAQQQNNTSAQQPAQQSRATVQQPANASNTNSAQHGTRNRASAPQQQPSVSSSTATASSSSGAYLERTPQVPQKKKSWLPFITNIEDSQRQAAEDAAKRRQQKQK